MEETMNSPDGLLLLNPSDSLLVQVNRYLGPEMRIGVIQAVQGQVPVHRVLDRGVHSVLLDATCYPVVAARLLQTLVVGETRSLAVYTEKPDPAMEVFVRSRGVPLLLGPMSPQEWQDAMSMLARPAPPAELWAG
jgi:hypothetical protein